MKWLMDKCRCRVKWVPPIARWWFQGAILTYLVGFTVLGVLAYLVYRDQPPLPTKVIASDTILFTRDDVLGGMHVFQRCGLMEYGSVYGHGAPTWVQISPFRSQKGRGGAQADWIANPEDVRKLTAFFGWTAWTPTAIAYALHTFIRVLLSYSYRDAALF